MMLEARPAMDRLRLSICRAQESGRDSTPTVLIEPNDLMFQETGGSIPITERVMSQAVPRPGWHQRRTN